MAKFSLRGQIMLSGLASKFQIRNSSKKFNLFFSQFAFLILLGVYDANGQVKISDYFPEIVHIKWGEENRSIVPDNSYGKGGHKITITTEGIHYSKNGDSATIKNEESYYTNPKGDTAKDELKTTLEDGTTISSVRTINHDEKGTTSVNTHTITDPFGKILYDEKEIQYRSNDYSVPLKYSATRTYIDKNGTKHTERRNSSLDNWVDANKVSMPPSDPSNVSQPANAPESALPSSQNIIFVGPALMFLNYSPSNFSSWGMDGSYTRMLSQRIGISVDGGVYWHKFGANEQNSVESYNLYSFTAGLRYLPCKNPLVQPQGLQFSLHLLAGAANLHSKYGGKIGTNLTSGTTYTIPPSSNNETSFTLTAGFALDYHFSHLVGIRLQPDYTPTFFKNSMQNSVQNNFRISLGGVLKF